MIYSNVFPTENQPYRLLPVEHNWQTPFRVSYEYKTDLIVSDNGTEQRRAVRYYPRRTFEYTVLYKGPQKHLLDRFLDRPPNMLAIVPESNHVIRTKGPMMSGQSFVDYLGGIRPWFRVGMTIMLNDEGRCETRTVNAFSETRLSFAESNDTPFPRGCLITEARFARLNQDPQSVRQIGSAGTMSFSALLDPVRDDYEPKTAGSQFEGFREILPWKPDWGQPPQATHHWDHDDIDYGYGSISTFVPVGYPQRILKTNYWQAGESAQQIIDFFGRQKGMNREFLVPSFENAIPYYAAAGLTKAILIKGLDFAYTYKDSKVYRRIMIRKKDGTILHRQVDFIEALPDTDTSVVWLTEALPDTPLAPNDTYGIWWVTVARMATDRLDCDWLTDNVVQLAFTIQNLENLDV